MTTDQGIPVVAEEAEARLASIACDFIRGYAWSRSRQVTSATLVGAGETVADAAVVAYHLENRVGDGGRGHSPRHRRATIPATSASSDTVARSPSAIVARPAGMPSDAEARTAAARAAAAAVSAAMRTTSRAGQPALDARERREFSRRGRTLADEQQHRCTESDADTPDVAMLRRDQDGAASTAIAQGSSRATPASGNTSAAGATTAMNCSSVAHRPRRQERREHDGDGSNR